MILLYDDYNIKWMIKIWHVYDFLFGNIYIFFNEHYLHKWKCLMDNDIDEFGKIWKWLIMFNYRMVKSALHLIH